VTAWPQRRKPAYFVRSVDNTLRLLQLLRDLGEIRVKDAAMELGISPSTVHRLMSMLVFRGFAVQDESRAYFPGPSIGVEPIRLEGTRELHGIAKPHLTELCDDLGESAYCMILAGLSIRFILTVESSYPAHAGDRHGLVLPAEDSAGGHAILAGLHPEELARLLAPTGHRGMSEATYDRLRLRLRLVRARGYALSVEEVEAGIVSVAVPLRGSGKHPPAAVSISGSTDHLEKVVAPAAIERLMSARDDIDRELALAEVTRRPDECAELTAPPGTALPNPADLAD
jgi:IclR family transcriptional regulator, acetate operon repressor